MRKANIETDQHFDNVCDIIEFLENQPQPLDQVQICTCLGEFVFRFVNGNWKQIG